MMQKRIDFGYMHQNPPSDVPNDGNTSNTTSDNKNSWVGAALLQEIFLKEHNAILAEVANNHPGLSDDEL